jgi:hypothetical protein
LFQYFRPEVWGGFRNDVMANQDGCGGALDVVAYGGQSTKGRELAQYFMPNCKPVLTVNSLVQSPPDATTVPFADLMAQNFNVFTANGEFESTVSFCAKHTEAGLGLHYKHGFWYNDDSTKWWYLDVTLPITTVSNTFQINENVTNTGGGVSAVVPGAVANMAEAFNQSAWNYGRVNGCKMKKTGVADMQIALGWQWAYTDCCQAASFVGVLAPTGNKPCGQFVFEPVVGHGGSVGLFWGSEGGYNFWNSCDDSWHLSFDWAVFSLYLFKTKQVRSFDLKGKPWSRYQEVYANLAQAEAAADAEDANLSTPGINVFTQCVCVTPGFQYNATTALVFDTNCGFESEVGWNFFAREAECIKANWVTGPAIKKTTGAGETNPIRNISNSYLSNLTFTDEVALANYDFSVIQASDLDLQSAAHPAGITFLVYGSLGWRWDEACLPTRVSLGGSYEFPGNSFGTMKRWTLWGKVGFSF